MESSTEKDYFSSLKLPHYNKAKIELWKYINPTNMDSLLACFEVDSETGEINHSQHHHKHHHSHHHHHHHHHNNNSSPKRETPGSRTSPRRSVSRNTNCFSLFSRLLSKLLDLNLHNKKDVILIEMYYYLIKFCIRHEFTKEQMSALICIQKRIHDLNVETSFGNIDHAFDLFRNLLLVYSVHRPPFSLCIFNTKQIELISDYLINAYFKQYKFYKYVFTSAIRLDLKFKYRNQTAKEALEVSGGTNNANGEEAMFFNDESIIDDDIRNLESRQANQISNETTSSSAAEAELKEFIKQYLSAQLDKMKGDITILDDLHQESSLFNHATINNNKNKTEKSSRNNSSLGNSGAKSPNKKK